MGCPDAVRAGLTALKGIGKVEYDTERDLFSVQFEPEQIKMESIIASVREAGKKMGQEYVPQVIA